MIVLLLIKASQSFSSGKTVLRYLMKVLPLMVFLENISFKPVVLVMIGLWEQ